MRYDVRLFINGQELEFSTNPNILLNLKETDLRNPTINHNSFSKQITVEGTPRNNDIFGHIWELTRIQDQMQFNPIRKTDFQLFVNDNLFEKGYVKLDKVTRTNNTIQYTITLFGGLGQFLYNLSYMEGTNLKKTLADLFYAQDGYIEPELDFIINKDMVYEAWGQLAGFGTSTNARWNYINFIPAYNGYPQDMDSSRVLINRYGMTAQDGFQKNKSVDNKTYTSVLGGQINEDGYSLGEMPGELTEWETRDLRSYMQRPCFSMYKIIDACTNPQNNGGYEVKLDSHFFHTMNPYYRDAWITMPLIKDLDGNNAVNNYNISSAYISPTSTQQYGADIHSVIYSTPSVTSINNVNMTLSVRFSPSTTTSSTYLYPHHTYNARNVVTLQGSTYVKDLESNAGVSLQLLAYGSNGEIVGQSMVYFLGGDTQYPHYNKFMWRDFYRESGDLGLTPEYMYLEGFWKKVNGTYIFVDGNENPVDINFTLSAPTNYSALILKVKTPYGYYINYAWSGDRGVLEENHDASTVALYTTKSYSTTGNHTMSEALQQDRVLGSFNFVITNMKAIATDYEGFFSGTRVTKKRLLTTEYTPADYLLSYCKLFGLYFYYDATEASSNPEKYPSGVIHIMDRDSFYTEEYIDLNALIDWNKKMEISPAMAASKYYNFDLEHNESEAENAYELQYGTKYGSQLINTNYNFDNNTTELYDGNVFKAGIMALEKDKYFKKTPAGLPVYQYNGLKYMLFNRPSSTAEYETTEIDFPVTTTNNYGGINPDYDGFDSFPKLQFHTEENEPSDGANVLVFFRNGVNVNCDYWLTDDVSDMAILNDGSPCWMLTRSEYNANGTQIARRLTTLPYFTREMTLLKENGYIVHSWNFGHPQITFVPDLYTTDFDSVYDKTWKNYIKDLYDEDTRKLTCYVKTDIDGYPWVYWLRRYYWFENSLWRLNEIKDLNVADYDTTKMEFIKVNDVNNYKLSRIEYQGANSIVLKNSEIECTGGSVYGTVYMQGGGSWWAADHIWGEDANGRTYYFDSEDVMSPHTGHGVSTNFVISIPQSSAVTPINYNVVVTDTYDNSYKAYFTQRECEYANQLILDQISVPCAGGNISGRMEMNNPGSWIAADNIVGTDPSGFTHTLPAAERMHPYSGEGLTTTYFYLNMPANTYSGDVTWALTIEDTYDNPYVAYFGQFYCPEMAFMGINPESAATSFREGTVAYSIITSGSAVSNIGATSDVSWCTPTVQGNQLSLSFTENTGTPQRTATITVTGTCAAGTVTATATLVQRGYMTLTLSPTSTTVANTATSTTVQVLLNSNVKQYTLDYASWLTPSYSSGSLRITFTANPDTSTTRTGRVIMYGYNGSGDSVSAETTVMQGSSTVVVTYTGGTPVACAGGTVTGTISQSNLGTINGWTASTITGRDQNGNTYTLSPNAMSPTGSLLTNVSFQISVPAQNAPSPITYTLTITDRAGNVFTSTFVQNTCPGSITTDKDTVYLNYTNSATGNVTVTTNKNWTSTINDN